MNNEELWENSVCDECGGNLVNGGKFVTPHKAGCSQDDREDCPTYDGCDDGKI
jgi:hypothetical protein